MISKKQTAVEWMVEQILPTISIRLNDVCIKELIEIAKSLEKEQIIEAYEQGEAEWTPVDFRTAQGYFMETYGQ